MTSEREESLARAIIEDCGLTVDRIWPIVGGFVNHVFAIECKDQKVVCRFAINPHEKDSFGIEVWCLQEAERVGVPTAKLIRRGILDGVSYLVQTFVEGRSGSLFPEEVAWYELGRHAARIRRMTITDQTPDELFSRFGRDLPKAWHAHLSYHSSELNAHDPLLASGIYVQPQQSKLQRVIAELGRNSFEFGISHGDLAPRNLIMPEGGRSVIVDWGCATTGPSPWGDLETVFRWHIVDRKITFENVECFARGLGCDLALCLPTLEALSLLRHLDLVRWTLAQRPDLTAWYSKLASAGVKRFFEITSC